MKNLQKILSNIIVIIKILGNASMVLLWSGIIMAAVETLLPIFLSLAQRELVDKLDMNHAAESDVLLCLLAVACVMVVTKIVSVIFVILRKRNAAALSFKLRKELYVKCSRLSLAAYDEPVLYDKLAVAERLGAEEIENISVGLFTFITSAAQFVISGIILCQFSILLLFCVIIASFTVFIYGKQSISYEMFDKNRTNLIRRMNYYKNISTKGEYTKETKVYGMLPYTIGKYDSYNKAWNAAEMDYSIKVSKIQLLLEPVRELLLFVLPVLLLISRHVEMTVADFSYYISIIAICSSALNDAINTHFSREVANVRIEDWIAFLNIDKNERGGCCIPVEWFQNPPKIEFDHVSYRYSGADRNAINDISFCIAPGEKIALIGENGAGKTTLIKLICGLYEPSEGQIRINNRDIREFSQVSVYQLFSVVFQDYKSYNMTLAESLTLGLNAHECSDDELWNILEKFGADSIKKHLGGDLTRRLGKELYDDGTALSGGENQKITLARAFLQRGKVKLLDEPTASLDAYAERDVIKNYLASNNNWSAVIISHRISCAAMCDRILVLSDGEIIECGTHDELMRIGGEYSERYRRQADAY